MRCMSVLVGSPKISVHMIGIGGRLHLNSCWVRIHMRQELFCRRLVTGDKTQIYYWAPISKLEFVHWKDIDRPTFTRICKSAINWLAYMYGNSFSAIQTDCLWQAVCILERQLLVSTTQNQHSSYSMSSSRNSDESCHLWVWLFHENAPAHKSFVAQQAVCNCEFVQLNHSAYSSDLAASDHFLIRNLKYHFRGTWFIVDESLKIAVKAWSESQNRKFYFQCINSWQQKLKICNDVAWVYVKKCQRVWYNMLTFYSQVAKLFDRPYSYIHRRSHRRCFSWA